MRRSPVGPFALGAVLVIASACGGGADGEVADPPDTIASSIVTTSTIVASPVPTTANEPTSTTPTSGEADAGPATTGPATSGPSPSDPADGGGGGPRAIDTVLPPEASTVTELLAVDRPVVAVHAGGDFDAPHSTMYAYTEAALIGADVLEMDVMLTGDDVLVVHHDDTIDRTTPISGVVRDLTYAELEPLDNAHWFSGGVWVDQSLADDAYVWRGVRTGERPPPDGYGPDDFRIETFASVSETFPDHVLDVEIKVQADAAGEPDLERAIETARVLADEIARLDRTESILVVSFDDRVIEAFRSFAPDVATSPGLDILVAWYAGAEVEFAAQDVVFQVPPVFEGIEVLTADTVARAHADGFDVWAWMSSDDQETAEFYVELIDRGVDGLIVARPSTAVGVVGSL